MQSSETSLTWPQLMQAHQQEPLQHSLGSLAPAEGTDSDVSHLWSQGRKCDTSWRDGITLGC